MSDTDIITGVSYLDEEAFDKLVNDLQKEMAGPDSIARQKIDLFVKLHNDALDHLADDDIVGFVAYLIVMEDLVGPMEKFVQNFAQHFSTYMAKRDGIEQFAEEASRKIAKIRQTHRFLQKKGGETEENAAGKIRTGMIAAFRRAQDDAKQQAEFEASLNSLVKKATTTGVMPTEAEISQAFGLDELRAEAQANLDKLTEEKEEKRYIYRDIDV